MPGITIRPPYCPACSKAQGVPILADGDCPHLSRIRYLSSEATRTPGWFALDELGAIFSGPFEDAPQALIAAGAYMDAAPVPGPWLLNAFSLDMLADAASSIRVHKLTELPRTVAFRIAIGHEAIAKLVARHLERPQWEEFLAPRSVALHKGDRAFVCRYRGRWPDPAHPDEVTGSLDFFYIRVEAS